VLEQISAVYKVLQELHIEEKDTLLVLNKVDRIADHGVLARILTRYPHAVPISAATGDGLRQLQHAVSDALSRSFADLDIEAPVTNGKLLAFLAAHGEVLERKYLGDDRVLIHCRIPQRHTGGLRQEGVTARPHQPLLHDPAESVNRLPAIDAIEEVA
jgi:GTPase